MVEAVDHRCSQICAACGDSLLYGQSNYLLQIVHVKMSADGQGGFNLNFESVVDANEDYVYFPYYLEEICWKKEREAIQELMSEYESYIFRNPICACTTCGGSITQGELVGIAHVCIIKVSERDPDNENAEDLYMPPQNPDILCACCMQELNVNVTTYWEEGDFIDDAQKREAWSMGGRSAAAG